MDNIIYIGDNFKTMKSSDFNDYKGKIKFIYIDPPYNTENRMFAFNDINHTWSKDIYDRLDVAKDLMSDDGVIFISIDDKELANLMNICYDVFGKDNYVGLFVTKQSQRSNAKHINIIHEYILCCAKNKKKLPKVYIKRIDNPRESKLIRPIINRIKKAFKISQEFAYQELKNQIDNYIACTGETWIKNYSNIDNKGNVYFAKDLSTPSKPNKLDIEEIGLHLEPLATRGWASKEKILSLYNDNRICFKNGQIGRASCRERV